MRSLKMLAVYTLWAFIYFLVTLGTVQAECLRLDPEEGPYFAVSNRHAFGEKEDPPLVVAAWAGNTEVVTCRLKEGTPVDVRGFRGDTALMRACLFGNKDVAETLVGAGADVNLKNAEGNTALHLLASNVSGNIDLTPVARLLLNAKADINAQNNAGQTPLTMAMVLGVAYTSTYQNQHDLTMFLIENGADITAKKNEPWPPLMFSVLHNDIQVLDLLLRKGADPNTRNPLNQSALDIAVARGHGDIIHRLKTAGATITPPAAENDEADPDERTSTPAYRLETQFVDKTVTLKPESPGMVYLSDSPDAWLKKNLTVSVKANTTAEILEVRAYRPESGTPLRRFKVRVDDGRTGWASLQDLLCTSFLCDDDHPQRTFPFNIR